MWHHKPSWINQCFLFFPRITQLLIENVTIYLYTSIPHLHKDVGLGCPDASAEVWPTTLSPEKHLSTNHFMFTKLSACNLGKHNWVYLFQFLHIDCKGINVFTTDDFSHWWSWVWFIWNEHSWTNWRAHFVRSSTRYLFRFTSSSTLVYNKNKPDLATSSPRQASHSDDIITNKITPKLREKCLINLSGITQTEVHNLEISICNGLWPICLQYYLFLEQLLLVVNENNGNPTSSLLGPKPIRSIVVNSDLIWFAIVRHNLYS